MRGMLTVLWRGITARRSRIVATGVAVAAAVAFLSGTYVLTDTIDAGVLSSAIQATGGVSAFVTAAGGGGTVLAGPPTIPASVISLVGRTDGVSVAEGITTGSAIALNRQGHAVSSGASIGISVPADSRLRLFTLRSGHWPEGRDQVVIDAATAAELGVKPGGTLRVALTTGAQTFVVAGIVGFGSTDTLPGVSIVGFAPTAAPSLLNAGGRFAAIEVAGRTGVPASALAGAIKTTLGGGYIVRTAAQQAEHLSGTITGVASLIGTALGVFAAIALIVATLLIANIFAVTVAQRARELALFRCCGATRAQTGQLVLAEAALIGLAGGVVGLLGGIGLAVGLRAALGGLGLPLPAAAPVIAARTVVVSMVVAIGVTSVAASAATLRAAHSRPLAALSSHEAATEQRQVGRARRFTAGLVALAGAYLLAASSSLASVGLGALCLITGAGLAGPMLVRPLTAPARWLLSGVTGFGGRLAGRQMLRNPRRVAGSVAALAVAVATVTVVAALAATFTSSQTLDVRRSLRADYVITTPPNSGFAPSVASERISHLPGVTTAVGIPCGTFQAPGVGSETLCGINPATLSSVVDLDVTSGRLSDLTGGTITISARTSDRSNWHLGEVIPATYPVGGTHPTRLVAIYDYEEVAGSILIPLTDYNRQFPPAKQVDQTILVRAAPGAGTQVHSELTSVLGDYPQATLDDKTGYSNQVSSGIDFLATLAIGLLALSLLIGLMSVTTTLALGVVERTREIGLLRAVGAQAQQIRTIIRTEALATVTTGALTGLALGLAIGWPLATAIEVYILGPPGVPIPLIVAVLPTAMLAGLLAAALPARHAGHLDILTALRTE